MMIYDLSLHVTVAIGTIARIYFGWTLSLILCSFVLLVWRLWAFTIYPLLNPGELEYLPYWIPCKHWRATQSLILRVCR